MGLFAEGGDVPDNPGLKKLASKAPQVVEKMGFDPQEVINAYMGGKINYAPGGRSIYGTSAGAGATATPEEEEEVLERQKEIERDTALGRFLGGPRSQKKYDDMMKELPFEVMTMPGSYLRPGVETFTDDEGEFIMPIKKARPLITSKKDKAKAKELKKQEETDVQNKMKAAEDEKKQLAEQEEQRKASLLAAQQKNQQPEVGGNMYNALMENILGIVGREQTDLEKYTDALTMGAAGARGFDVAMRNVGREDAQTIIDKGLSDISGISKEDRKRLKEDTSLLTTGATLELEKGKIGADLQNNITKMAMEQLKLNSAEAREVTKQVLTTNPFLIQDYVRATDPAKKKIFADQLTDALMVAKSSLDQAKMGIVAGSTDPFDQSKYIDKNLNQPITFRQSTSPSRTN